MYFIGVTTGQSAIHRFFGEWCRIAGRPGVELLGIDLPVGAAPKTYCRTLQRILADGDSWGAIVTTHKVAVVEHAGHLIASRDDTARELGEVNCLERRRGVLTGRALDLLTAGAALDRIVDVSGRQLLVFGAGGAGTALALALRKRGHAGRVLLADIDPRRLSDAARISGASTVLTASPGESDALLASMPPGSVIVNATGLGKDLPGSPISEDAGFPEGAVAWDFNYRGDLRFLETAKRAGAVTADGWDYFLRGWSVVMSHVLDFELTGERLEAFRNVAAAKRLRR